MYRIGIDVGSTYTKYCILDDNHVRALFMEQTPIRQKEYFNEKIQILNEKYPAAQIISCGYGRKNVDRLKTINELTALARGCYFITGNNGIILDVGGQDTKIISQECGMLREFFINDKCAAGSGMFLANIINMVGADFDDIDLTEAADLSVRLSSVCAVFAQSEIVELIADNHSEESILHAVIWQIFVKARPLLAKMEVGPVLLSGGISQIRGVADFAAKVLGRTCRTVEEGAYLAAIGCALEGKSV